LLDEARQHRSEIEHELYELNQLIEKKNNQ